MTTKVFFSFIIIIVVAYVKCSLCAIRLLSSNINFQRMVKLRKRKERKIKEKEEKFIFVFKLFDIKIYFLNLKGGA